MQSLRVRHGVCLDCQAYSAELDQEVLLWRSTTASRPSSTISPVFVMATSMQRRAINAVTCWQFLDLEACSLAPRCVQCFHSIRSPCQEYSKKFADAIKFNQEWASLALLGRCQPCSEINAQQVPNDQHALRIKSWAQRRRVDIRCQANKRAGKEDLRNTFIKELSSFTELRTPLLACRMKKTYNHVFVFGPSLGPKQAGWRKSASAMCRHMGRGLMWKSGKSCNRSVSKEQ